MVKLKYYEYLKNYNNCPPEINLERNANFFRWVHNELNENDFKPVLLINSSRKFDTDDENCDGYGLSFFNTEINAYSRYKQLVKHRQKMKNNLGTFIAKIEISTTDGVASLPNNKNYGHITFHEYFNANLFQNMVMVNS